MSVPVTPGSPPAPARAVAGRSALAWLALLLAAAAALRFYLAATTPGWFVEIYILRVLARPLPEELRLAAADIHPPLQFLLRWAWGHLAGIGVMGQKSLSVLAAIASMAIAFPLARRVFATRAALVALALLTVNAAHLQYSQEIEEYSLEWVFVGVMLLAGWRWIEQRRGRDGVIYVAATALGSINHYETLAVAAILALSGSLALGPDRRAIRGWLLLHLAAFALFLPFLPTLLRQLALENHGRFFRFPSPSLIGSVWRAMGFASRFALAPMLVLSLVPLARAGTRRFALFVWPLILLAPLATRFWVVILPREVLFILPPWLVLVAGGLERIPWSTARTIVLVALLALGVRGLRPLPRYREAMVVSRAEHALAPRLAPGALVVHAESHSLICFEQYHPEYRNRLLSRAGERVGFFEGGLMIPDSAYLTYDAWRQERDRGARWWGVRVDRAVSARGMVWRSGEAAAESMAVAGDTLWREAPVTVWGGRGTNSPVRPIQSALSKIF